MSAMDDLVKLLKKDKRTGSDYTGTVTRVDGQTAYVRLTGSEISDTPVTMSINANVGDKVRVRVNGGKAWITGNDTAPPTNDAKAIKAIQKDLNEPEGKVSKLTKLIERAGQIAANTNQYFWHTKKGTDTGAHITEVPRETFLKDPENGGGNLLARSNGIALRDGLTEMAQFHENGIDFYDRLGGNVVDIDVNGSNYTTDFYEYHTNNSVASGDTWAIQVESPYFTNFVNRNYGLRLIFDQGAYDWVNQPWDADFTATMSGSYGTASISYSYSNKTIAVTYSGSTTPVRIDAQIEWRATVPASAFTFGTRFGDKGAYSATIGEGLKAEYATQVAFGTYNDNQSANAVEVGGGDGDRGRINLFELKKTTGNLWINGTLTQGSDRRLKEHKTYLDDDAVEFIRNLKPAHYIKDGQDQVGFYAQDVEAVDPWHCMTGEANGYMTLSYTEIIAPLVKYCQSLEKRIEELEANK